VGARAAAVRARAEAALQPRLLDGRRRLLRSRPRSRQARRACRDLERRPLPGHRHPRPRPAAEGGRAAVRARHVQRLGHPYADHAARRLRPPQLSPRDRLGGGERDDLLWIAAVRIRRGGGAPGAGDVRPRRPLHRRPHPRDGRRLLPRGASDVGRLSAVEHASALERELVPAGHAGIARPGTLRCAARARGGSGAAGGLPTVELHGLRVGGTTASLRFWRDDGGRGNTRVLEKDGPLHVVRQPPPEALRVGPGRRLRALLAR
jgi:hypothetical protein